jgi:uncharacterized SAM-binding protein YcdF (DUF218 family)
MKDKLKKWWGKRWVKILVVLTIIFAILFALRYPILRGMGSYLVAEDPLVKSQSFFILGGNSYERGMEAIRIWQQFPDARFVASGGNYPTQILALDTSMTEASLTRHFLLSRGVPASQIDTLSGSTSTMEESIEILAFCKSRQLNDITLISSSYHLRRMRMVFEDKFSREGIHVHFRGAVDQEFNAAEWWSDERGLITANNEYVKIFYYWLKY